ncbi:Beta-cyclopiazonate dehydrogenase [Lachnellula hyalina]|uniref:Beta-cyclopiazonate dehydrogenase n=1 Tax=Lachnellula hyalina TaxID=1316788 RepID=A0A8H8U1Y3_9HELO|nr:Beta-cyclopiazonate dehydrogenase [Lachnellula hyalina]TVY30554.1 Beta-cyclopiazonate dehydrogenase [Lachnellula hyalina]
MLLTIFSASNLIITLLVTLRVNASIVVNGNSYSVDRILTRDFAIIGGGSTGTYSAIRLKDLGNTVVVIEGKDRLGGHTETYHDPKTGGTIDIGVVVYHDLDIVRTYFARLNVSLITSSFASTDSQYMDFQTGKLVPDYSPADPTAALGIYAEQLAKYPYVELGFDLPYPVPDDLLMLFGDFVLKYGLQDLVGFLGGFAQGLGDILKQPTLYIFKNFGSDLIRNLQTGFLTTALHDNSLLYESASADLGQDVVLNSSILEVDRSGNGVKVVIKTPSGITLIKSRKLIFTIPPKVKNLQGWDLDNSETSLFNQFSNSGYYTAIIQNSGIPDNLSIEDVSPNTLYNLPPLPAIYSLSPSGIPGLLSVKLGSVSDLTDEEAKQQIISSVTNLQLNRTGPNNPELAVYSSHTPFELTVPPSAVAGGFYKSLYSLQGERHTWYLGAAFHTHDSSLLWQFTEALLPNITAF